MHEDSALTDPLQAPATPVPLSIWSNPWHNLAFGFGAGGMPRAPGTWGTLVGLPFVLLWASLPLWGQGLVLVASIVFGVWLCGKVARELGVHDHEGIVWDEMVGIWLTCFLLPAEPLWLALGFVVFRVMDIAKPWPISWVDRHVHGGFGIMLDDVLAGVAAWGVMQAFVWAWA